MARDFAQKEIKPRAMPLDREPDNDAAARLLGEDGAAIRALLRLPSTASSRWSSRYALLATDDCLLATNLCCAKRFDNVVSRFVWHLDNRKAVGNLDCPKLS